MSDGKEEVQVADVDSTAGTEAGGPGILIDGLARLPEKTLLDEARLASLLCVTPRTVRRMVSRFELPPSISLGGRSVWFAGRILAHIEEAAERAERDASRRAKKISALAP